MQIQWTNISFREEYQTSWWPDALGLGLGLGFYG